jgi:colanic acid/amylovoran biosynthesis protein
LTKILLLNAGCSNRGTYALSISTINIIKKAIPQAEFVLMGSEIDQKDLPLIKLLALKPLKTPMPWVHLIECSLIRLFRKFYLNYPLSLDSPLNAYLQSDVVINSGGDHLSGEFGKFGLGSYLNICYAILLKKPIVLHGESLGYYRNPIYNTIAKIIFNNVDLILVRENFSKRYLEYNHISNPDIFVTADPAFTLDAANDATLDKIIITEDLKNVSRPLIGINPSGLIGKISGVSEVHLAQIFADLIDKLISDWNATIVLIPHVYTSNLDDRSAIRLIAERVKNKKKLKSITNEYTAQELKGIIGMCDLFIGTRMHATIASTSMLVPTVGIAYSHKMHGIIGEMLGLEDYIIEIENLTYDNLVSVVHKAWLNREDLKEHLSKKIPIIRENAFQNGKYIKLLLEDNHILNNEII